MVTAIWGYYQNRFLIGAVFLWVNVKFYVSETNN